MIQELWRLQFADINKQKYFVRIYADPTKEEGLPTSRIDLQGAESPFVTNEDGSDNIWEPVRPKNATLNIVTNDMEMVKTMIPKQNTMRPIVFAKQGEFEDDVIWCGYMSSEEYNQPYSSRHNEISIECIGVLEAMGSQYFQRGDMPAYCTIADMLYNMSVGVNSAWGKMPLYIPSDSENILTKYIMPGAFYDSEEVVDEEGINIQVQTKSAKEMLGTMCQLMGWTLREWKGGLLFYKHDYEGTYNEYDIEGITDQDGKLTPVGSISTNEVDMSDFNWHGANHQRSIVQGARKVTVKANANEMEMVLGLYDTKYASLCDDRIPSQMPPYTNRYKWVYYYKDNRENNLVECQFRKLASVFSSGEVTYSNGDTTTFAQLRYDLWQDGSITKAGWDNDRKKRNNNITKHNNGDSGDGDAITVGALKCRMIHEYGPKFYRYASGLYMLGAPMYNWPNTASTELDKYRLMSCIPIYKQESEKKIHVKGGYLKIDIQQYEHNFDNGLGVEQERASAFYFSLFIGSQSWKGLWYGQNAGWNYASNRFCIAFDKDKKIAQTSKPIYEDAEGFYVPIEDNLGNELIMDGYVKLYMYPMMCVAIVKENSDKSLTYTPDPSFDRAFFKEIKVTYIPPKRYKNIDDNEENEYVRNTGADFSENESVDVDLATDRNNKYSEHVLRLNDEYPLTQLVYHKNGQNVGMRPESNLLKRMATYYGKSRSIVDITISDDVEGAKKIEGCFGEQFAPLSIETDWVSGERKVKCFEYETEDNTGYDANYHDPTSSDRYDCDPTERDGDWEADATAPEGGSQYDGNYDWGSNTDE